MDANRTLDEIVLFLLDRARGRRLSVAKLWKLLFLIDLMHVEQFGRSVADLRYARLRHGPRPANANDVLGGMVGRGAIRIRTLWRFRDRVEVICEPARWPDLREFPFSVRAVLEETVLEWNDATSAQIGAALAGGGVWARARFDTRIAIAA